MGLYLAVFVSDTDDDEIDGVEVGSYDVFHDFRSTVARRLESKRWGSRFPVLMDHSDCDGSWSPADAELLVVELTTIAAELGRRDRKHTDIEGDPLTQRLRELAEAAIAHRRPIDFQ